MRWGCEGGRVSVLGVFFAVLWVLCLLSVAFCALWGCGPFCDDVKLVWFVWPSLRLEVCILGVVFRCLLKLMECLYIYYGWKSCTYEQTVGWI